jgi:hypothetical protein
MSGIATGTALLIGGGLAAGGSLGASALEANAAGKAATTQADAAKYAAQIQGDLGQESLANEVQTQQQNQANEQPWLQTGANSLASLGYLLGITPGGTVGGGPGTPGQTLSIPGVSGTVNMPGVTPLTGTANTNLGTMGSLMQAYPGGPFTAPTEAAAAQDPGYKFALDQGEGAVQAGAAANGSLLTGGTLNAEQQFGQGLANTNYNNVYNRALQTYGTNYNTWANTQANQFNRLAALAGMGQTSAATLGTQNLTSAGQVANTLTNTGAQIGQDYQNAGAATASGYVGGANAWGGGISGATNSLSQMMMLQQLMQGANGNPYKNLYNAQNAPPPGVTPNYSLDGYQIPYEG